ncbi:MAG: acyltransferase [Eubacterium sp.]|nr:acyltransferase [Eubacterium sp.]
MKESSKKKDIYVELLRIIGCLMVIGTHIKLDGVINGKSDIVRTFVACAVGDGVAVFWVILGFFFFEVDDYRMKLRNTIRKILIPLGVYSVIMFFFYNWIVGNCGLRESIIHSSQEYWNILYYGLLRWQNVIPGCDHLWFLYVYVIVVLLYPALKGLHSYLNIYVSKDLTSKRKKYILLVVLLFIVLLANDITINGLFEFSHHAFSASMAAGIYVLLGAFLYKNISTFKGDIKLGIIGGFGWMFINLIRSVIQYYMYSRVEISEEPLFWFTSYALLSVICIVLFVFGCFGWIQKNEKTSLLVCSIGKTTMYIYIFHVAVNDILSNRFDIRNKILTYTGVVGIKVFIYEIIYGVVVFIASLIVSKILMYLKDIFFKSVKEIVRKKKLSD